MNEEIDSVDNMKLAQYSQADQRSHTCGALVILKFDRNVKVHEVLMRGPNVKKDKPFPNDL